jgi:hypothetical protein
MAKEKCYKIEYVGKTKLKGNKGIIIYGKKKAERFVKNVFNNSKSFAVKRCKI